MKKNEKLYREEQLRLDTSGAAGAVSRTHAWPLFKKMSPLMAKLPNNHPEITMSAGTSSTLNRRSPGESCLQRSSLAF